MYSMHTRSPDKPGPCVVTQTSRPSCGGARQSVGINHEAFTAMKPAWHILIAAFVSVSVCVCGSPTGTFMAANAAPWTRLPGETFIESRVDFFTSDEAAGDGTMAARIDRIESNLYAEIGVGAGFMVGGKFAYADVTVMNDTGAFRFNGISEFEAFAQKTFWKRPRDILAVKVSGAGLRRIENGDADGLSRDGIDLETRLLYGRTIRRAPFKTFSTLEAGYRKRLGDNADEWRADALIGIEPAKRWLLLGEASASFSAGNARNTGADFDVVRLRPSAVYILSDRWALRATATFDVSTRNLTPGRTLSLGIWTAF